MTANGRTDGKSRVKAQAGAASAPASRRTVEPSTYDLAGAPLPPPAQGPGPIARPAHASRASIFSKAFKGGAIDDSQIQGLAVLLIVLSAADLLMTARLLHTSARFFEANPLARWFFARWNITGLVLFKFSILAGVTIVSEFVERRRPGWGRFILLIGCLGAAYAFYRGFTLYMAHHAIP
jgi:hypothetical protein